MLDFLEVISIHPTIIHHQYNDELILWFFAISCNYLTSVRIYYHHAMSYDSIVVVRMVVAVMMKDFCHYYYQRHHHYYYHCCCCHPCQYYYNCHHISISFLLSLIVFLVIALVVSVRWTYAYVFLV